MTLQQLAIIPDDSVTNTSATRHCSELSWDICRPKGCQYPTYSPTSTTPTTAPPTKPPEKSSSALPVLPTPVATPAVTDIPDTGNAPQTGVPPEVIGGSGAVSNVTMCLYFELDKLC